MCNRNPAEDSGRRALRILGPPRGGVSTSEFPFVTRLTGLGERGRRGGPPGGKAVNKPIEMDKSQSFLPFYHTLVVKKTWEGEASPRGPREDSKFRYKRATGAGR